MTGVKWEFDDNVKGILWGCCKNIFWEFYKNLVEIMRTLLESFVNVLGTRWNDLGIFLEFYKNISRMLEEFYEY